MKPDEAVAQEGGGTELVIALGIAPTSSAIFTSALPLLRPALLYGDRVVVYSPSVLLAVAMSQIGSLGRDELIQLASQVSPSEADQLQTLRRIRDELAGRRGKTKEQVLALAKLNRELDRTRSSLADRLDSLLVANGVDQWMPAIDAGLIEVSHLGADLDDPNVQLDDLLEHWVDRLVELVRQPHGFPLFDRTTGGFLKSLQSEDDFELSTVSTQRTRHVSTATGLIDRLPSFPMASVADIVQIREELLPWLTAFKTAVHRLSKEMVSSPLDTEEFSHEMASIWTFEVEPALDDLREQIRGNRYLAELARVTLNNAGSLFTHGGVLLGVAHLAELSEFLAPLGAGVEIAAKAAVQRARSSKKLEQHRFMYLHQIEGRLSSEP